MQHTKPSRRIARRSFSIATPFPGGAASRLLLPAGVALAAILAAAALAGAQPAVSTSPVSSTDAPARDVLVLGQLYRDVHESPKAEAARAVARAAHARVPGASLPPDPQLQLGLMNYALPDLKPMDPVGMASLQVMQMVPLAGKLGLSGRAAGAQASAADARATDVAWEVRTRAAMLFYELHRIDAGLEVGRETVRLLQDVRSTAEAMYRVGAGRQTDVLRAGVELARMAEDTLRMSAMRVAVAAKLNALLDRPGDARIASPVLPAFPESLPPLESFTAQADSGRPMLRAASFALDAARTESRLAERELWPDLVVGVQYGQRPGTMGTERMGSLMVGASLPVFARNRQLRMREETAAMQQMAAADLAAMRADTRARVTEAYADIVRARNLIALYRTTILPQAEATVASAHAAYRVGSVDFMTLLDGRMSVNDFRQELLALEAEHGAAWAELEMLLGRELIDADTPAARIAASPAPAGEDK